MFKRLVVLLALFFSLPVMAQQSVPMPSGMFYLNTNPSPSVWTPVSPTNPLPVAGTFSASIAGFRPTAYGTPISATTGGATGTLPAGAEVVATNVGTFGAFCKLGATVDTSGQYVPANGGWFAFAISSDTQLTCEGVGGTTTINMAGGSGLPTGTGGGGGGSGGGTSATDESTFTAGTTAITPIGGAYWSSIPALTNGQTGAAAMTANRSVHTLDDNSAATLAAVQAGTAINGATYPASSVGIGWKDGSGNIQPAAAATPWPIQQAGQYPINSTPYTASATGTTAATTATLAGAASVTTYICGFSIRANATAAATGNATVTGTISGTLNFTQWTAPLASGLGVTEMIFSPCVPASAANTGIAVVSAAPGSGGVVSVTAWGYKL